MRALLAAIATTTLLLTGCSISSDPAVKSVPSSEPENLAVEPTLDEILLSDANIPDVLVEQKDQERTEDDDTPENDFGCPKPEPEIPLPKPVDALERSWEVEGPGFPPSLGLSAHKYESPEVLQQMIDDLLAFAETCKEYTETGEDGVTIKVKTTTTQVGDRVIVDDIWEITRDNRTISISIFAVLVVRDEYLVGVAYTELGTEANKTAQLFAEAQAQRLEDVFAGKTPSEEEVVVDISLPSAEA